MQKRRVSYPKTPYKMNPAVFLKRIVGKEAMKRGFISNKIVTNWGHLVGSNIASLTVPIKIAFLRGMKNKGTLYVDANSGAAAVKLKYISDDVIEKINVFFGYGAIDNIKIRQIDFKRNEFSLTKKQKKIEIEGELSPLETKELLKKLIDIKDEKTKKTLFELGRSIILNKR